MVFCPNMGNDAVDAKAASGNSCEMANQRAPMALPAMTGRDIDADGNLAGPFKRQENTIADETVVKGAPLVNTCHQHQAARIFAEAMEPRPVGDKVYHMGRAGHAPGHGIVPPGPCVVKVLFAGAADDVGHRAGAIGGIEGGRGNRWYHRTSL